MHVLFLGISNEIFLMDHIHVFPQIAESWNKLEDNDTQPSRFASVVTNELSVL